MRRPLPKSEKSIRGDDGMKGTRFKELILQEGTILADRYEVRDMISISVYYTIYQVWDRKNRSFAQ